MSKKRRQHSPEFKAKVDLEALKGIEPVPALAAKHQITPCGVGQWKKEIAERLPEVFARKPDAEAADAKAREDQLYRKIGRLEMELDWLKKKLANSSVAERRRMIEPEHPGFSVTQQFVSCPRAGAGGEPALDTGDRRSPVVWDTARGPGGQLFQTVITVLGLGFRGGGRLSRVFHMALAFLFSGQGAQKVGMGRSLYEQSPAARSLYDEATRVLGWDLAKLSFEGPENELTQTKVCQPALFVHGLALVGALRELGKLPAGEPKLALGLSLGEVTAYAAAGVFDFGTGLRIVAERGRLMQQACEQTTGGMAAIVGEDPAKISALCTEFDIELANFNAPGQIIVSGEKAKVEAAVTAAKSRGMKKVVPLNVAGAYHSRLMEPARAQFAAFLAGISFQRPAMTVFTNTTGLAISEPAEIKGALVAQVVSSVRWEECLRNAAAAGASEFWELGPGGVLSGLARRTDKTWAVRSFAEFADAAA